MALGLSTGGSGDYKEIVKYDARAGRMFRVDRAGDGSKNPIDITNDKPRFIIDFGGIEVGWMRFAAGVAPDVAVVPLGQRMPPQPSPDHKQGFRVSLFAPKALGGEREFATSSKCVIGAINDLHTKFEAAPEAAEGKVPVVELAGSVPVTSKGPQGSSTNYSPVFNIVAWAERPAELGARTVPAPGVQLAPAPRPAAAPALTQTTRELVDDEIPF